ncbi:MAG: capsule assembly Wzi family protein [Bacteroidota bacterium]|jgi:hypothetical protein
MRLCAILLFSLMAYCAWAQDKKEPSLELGAGVTNGTYTPFWLRANQYGAVPTKESYGTAAVSFSDFVQVNQRTSWGYGVRALVNLTETKADVLLQEAYVKGKFGIFELQAGRKKQIQGLVDSTLSSGSYIWSGNALPMPMINLFVQDYWAPKFVQGIVGFKGNYAHGWFGNQRSDVADFYLHQKSFYGRLGKPNWLFKFYGGFNHQVQWGGTLKYADPGNFSGKNGKIASGLKEYFYMITGQSMNVVGGDTATYGINDGWNRLGNHLGSVDVGMEIDWKKAKIFFYRQSIYEDGSLYHGNNITDGLHGMSFTRKAEQGLTKVVLEYLNTASQGGSVFIDSDVNRGLDNYFNNSVYREGWTYAGKGIGTPMMTLDSETDLTNTNLTSYDNNRVESFYIGIEAKIGENALLFRGSMSNAFGWFDEEYIPVKKQYSIGLQWQRPVQLMGYDAQLKAAVGADKGLWKPDVIGGNVSLVLPLN